MFSLLKDPSIVSCMDGGPEMATPVALSMKKSKLCRDCPLTFDSVANLGAHMLST